MTGSDEAREALAWAAYADGCRESTRDEILNEPLSYLAMVKVKASVALDVLDKTLSQRPSPHDEGVLNGYRAAVSFNAADAWDGCSDCMDILRAARTRDTAWDWAGDPNRVATELRRIRRDEVATLSKRPSPLNKAANEIAAAQSPKLDEGVIAEVTEALRPFAMVGQLIEEEGEGFGDDDTFNLIVEDGHLLDRFTVRNFREARRLLTLIEGEQGG